MEDFFYMVASVPIMDFSFIGNYTWRPETFCPCLGPFHKIFDTLKNNYIPHDITSLMGHVKCVQEFVHVNRNAFQ